jgi:hypothetical protein
MYVAILIVWLVRYASTISLHRRMLPNACLLGARGHVDLRSVLACLGCSGAAATAVTFELRSLNSLLLRLDFLRVTDLLGFCDTAEEKTARK